MELCLIREAQMVLPLIVAGVGISPAIPASQNAVMNSVAPGEIGKASGTFSMMRQLGGAFGLAIPVAVFSGAGSYASPSAFSHGFARAVGVSATLSLLGAVAGMVLRARRGAAAPGSIAAVSSSAAVQGPPVVRGRPVPALEAEDGR